MILHKFKKFFFIFEHSKILIIVDWTGKEEDADDVNVWEDNWDDDNVEDDFSQQLRYISRNKLFRQNQ